MIYQDLAANIFLDRELKRKVGQFRFLDRDRMVEIARKDIANLGLDFDIHREVDRLSGGERQMVTVARALQFKPRALLMKEPTAALSTEKIRKFPEMINELITRIDHAGEPLLYRHPACLRSRGRDPRRQDRWPDAAP